MLPTPEPDDNGDFDTDLQEQAPRLVGEHLRAAVAQVDATLGDGFAKAHPELIAAFLQATALGMGAATIARAVEGIAAEMFAANQRAVEDARVQRQQH